MYVIWWRAKETDAWEELDTAESREERRTLRAEYEMAFRGLGMYKYSISSGENS